MPVGRGASNSRGASGSLLKFPSNTPTELTLFIRICMLIYTYICINAYMYIYIYIYICQLAEALRMPGALLVRTQFPM